MYSEIMLQILIFPLIDSHEELIAGLHDGIY